MISRGSPEDHHVIFKIAGTCPRPMISQSGSHLPFVPPQIHCLGGSIKVATCHRHQLAKGLRVDQDEVIALLLHRG